VVKSWKKRHEYDQNGLYGKGKGVMKKKSITLSMMCFSLLFATSLLFISFSEPA